MEDMTTAEALVRTLESQNIPHIRPVANVVDVVDQIADATYCVAKAIADPAAAAGRDDTGGYVNSLTEAVMGMTAGLCKIASSINYLADAVRERDSDRTDTSNIG
ncbi:MAG: hypothetical protein ACO395_07420 [Pontimonas sp.]